MHKPKCTTTSKRKAKMYETPILSYDNCEVIQNIKPYIDDISMKAMKTLTGKMSKKLVDSVVDKVQKKCNQQADETDVFKKNKIIKDKIKSYAIDYRNVAYESDCNDENECTYTTCADISLNDCLKHFSTWNKFFTRETADSIAFDKCRTKSVKCDARYISSSEYLYSPVDCRLVAYENISKASTYWIKSKEFELEKLLKSDKDESSAKLIKPREYEGGTILIFRLAPDDYHKFRFPFDCTYINYYNGKGDGNYSVNPILIKSNIDVFGENVRQIHILEHALFGQVLYIIVGATCVRSIKIHKSVRNNTQHNMGDHFGTFYYGGSTIIMLFKKESVTVAPRILNNSEDGIETYVHLGDIVGSY
jgi:phosphatidylserine decarboxylase precursor